MRLPGYRNYPREWEANGEIWTLSFVNKLSYRTRPIWGETDPSSFTVRITTGLSNRDLFSTFIHEVMHMLHWSYEIEDDIIKRKAFDPHKWIYANEVAIFEFIMDNTENFATLFRYQITPEG